MAKVKPGPIVSSVSGSVGPVTYYEAFGRTVVRARIRPHQKISSKRYWNRQAWKDLMYWWRIMKGLSRRNWNYHAGNRMHGVNLFVQVNRPVVLLPVYHWPQLEMLWPDMSAVRFDYGDVWRIYFNWGGIDYSPWPFVGFTYKAADGYAEGRYGSPIGNGWWMRDCIKKDDAAWYVCLYDWYGYPLDLPAGQIHRFMVDDIPLL